MKIKVGYTDYTVKAMPAELGASQWAATACCLPDTQAIYIRPEATPQKQGAALLHELIHAMFNSFGLPSEGLSEEDVATKLEIPLANLFRDNPRLPGVIRRALTEDKPIIKA
jgi:hypothetical protein